MEEEGAGAGYHSGPTTPGQVSVRPTGTPAVEPPTTCSATRGNVVFSALAGSQVGQRERRLKFRLINSLNNS